jgi:hypothetical protein
MSWTGKCNSCGRCCQTFVPDGSGYIVLNCENLEILNVPGQSQATRCKVWDKRWAGMPIKLMHMGRYVADSKCIPQYPRPQDAVPDCCSYEWSGPRFQKPPYNIGRGPTLVPHEV